VATEPATPEQELAWEAEKRPLATWAAGLAAVLVLGAPILLLTGVQRDFPTIGAVQALTPALQGRPAAAIDPRAIQVHFLDDHAFGVLSYAVLNLIGLLAMAYAIFYLFRATKARRPELPDAFRWLIIIGPAVAGLALLGSEIVTLTRASDFPSTCTPGGACDHDAVDHVLERSLLLGSLGTLGTLATAFALVITALNAMRVGLLTRFMGVLGIIVGVLFVLPITGGIPVVQAFWLGALVPLYAGRWPQGQPPAWLTGVAEPWPSAQDARAQQEAERNRREAELIKDAPAASEAEAGEDPVEPVRPAHPSSKKRRKRRR
jgi:hypothetical protein